MRWLAIQAILPCSLLLLGLAVAVPVPVAVARSEEPKGGAHTEVVPPANDGLTPEERMSRRFPQPVRVGDLVGIPIQDYNDRILGHVTEVTRNGEGKIGLVVSHCDWLLWGCRLVRVPIEAMEILARHLNLMDIKRDEFLALPAWTSSGETKIAADESIRIGLGRR